MNGILLYVVVVATLGVMRVTGGMRSGSEVGLIAFSGVTWWFAVTLTTYSVVAGLVSGGLAAIATALATADDHTSRRSASHSARAASTRSCEMAS